MIELTNCKDCKNLIKGNKKIFTCEHRNISFTNVSFKGKCDYFIHIPIKVIKHMELTCKRCKNQWSYKGRNDYRATCPKCGSSVIFNPKFPDWKRDEFRRMHRISDKTCKHQGCNFNARVKGYCVNCYNRIRQSKGK